MAKKEYSKPKPATSASSAENSNTKPAPKKVAKPVKLDKYAREWPRTRVLFDPFFLAQNIGRFLLNWFLSRRYLNLLFGIPALLGALAALYPNLTPTSQSRSQYVRFYQRTAANAANDGDLEKWELALNTLVQLDPGNQDTRFNLAIFRFNQKRTDDALAIMRKLADEKSEPARLWLSRLLLRSPKREHQDEAVKHLENVLAASPRRIDTNTILGEIYFARREFDKAEPCLRRVVNESPALRIMLVKTLVGLKRQDDALLELERCEKNLRKTLAETPGEESASLQLADALMLQGKQYSAQEILTTGLKANPESEPIRKALGTLIVRSAAQEKLRRSTTIDRLIQLLLTALEYHPGLVPAIDQLATLQLKPGVARPETLENIQKKLDELPEQIRLQPVFQFRQAFLHRLRNENEAAVECLNRTVEKAPELALRCAAELRILGQAELSRQHAEEFLKLKQAELDKDPSVPGPRLQVVMGLLFLGKSEEARALLEQGAQDHPSIRAATQTLLITELNATKDRPARLELLEAMLKVQISRDSIVGLARLADGKDVVAKQAMGTLKKMLELEQLSAAGRAHLNSEIGTVYVRRSDLESAKPYYETAARLQGRNAVYLNNLAHVLTNGESKDLDRGLKLVERSLELFPQNATVLQTHAEILLKLERYDDALVSLKEALTKAGAENARKVYLLMSEAYTNLGDVQNAEEFQRKAEEQAG